MLGKKITLNKRFCKFLRDTRKASHKSANEVSEAINKSQGWLAQIERGRLKTIKRSDLIDLFMYISGTSKELTKEILDDQLQSIEITEKKNLINSDGELLDFIGYVDFSQMRGHLQYAGKNLREFISDIQNMPSDKIEKELKDLFVQLDTLVITWIIKAFPNLKKSFSDEISQTNLFISLKLALDVYNNYCLDYGLDKIEVSKLDIENLRDKLSNPFIEKKATKLKDIDEYGYLEFDTVVKNFDFYDYMMWKNKGHYGNIRSEMPICFNVSNTFETDNYIKYDDIPLYLSHKEYRQIIWHLYNDLYFFYKKLNYQMRLNKEEDDDLRKEIEDLKQQK